MTLMKAIHFQLILVISIVFKFCICKEICFKTSNDNKYACKNKTKNNERQTEYPLVCNSLCYCNTTHTCIIECEISQECNCRFSNEAKSKLYNCTTTSQEQFTNSDEEPSVSGLAVGLIVAATLIAAAVIIVGLVIWKVRYNCRVPAFLSRNYTIRSSTTALTSIENPKEQDEVVYEQIAEHPYNELETTADDRLENTDIAYGPDCIVILNADLDNNNVENGKNGQQYSHLREHSRELTHDYNMSQGTELSNSDPGPNHTITSNRSTPNYTLATVINENKEHTDVGGYNKGRLDSEVSLPNITEEDNLESEYDVPPVRKDQEKNPYFQLEKELVIGHVSDDSLDTDYDVPRARRADPSMYFKMQNKTEKNQPTKDKGETCVDVEPDLTNASNNPYFQLEKRIGEDQMNHSDTSSSDADHHSDGDQHSDGDDNLIGDYDVPPPRRQKS